MLSAEAIHYLRKRDPTSGEASEGVSGRRSADLGSDEFGL